MAPRMEKGGKSRPCFITLLSGTTLIRTACWNQRWISAGSSLYRGRASAGGDDRG